VCAVPWSSPVGATTLLESAWRLRNELKRAVTMMKVVEPPSALKPHLHAAEM